MVEFPPDGPALGRLQTPEAAQALAKIALDHFLQTPLEVLLPPTWLATHLLADLSRAEPEALAARLKVAFEGLIDLCPPAETGANAGTLRASLPGGIEVPLSTLAGEARIPLRATLEILLDHPAMREVLRAVLVDTLTRFSSKVGSLLGEASRLSGAGRLPGAGRLGSVLGLARGVGSALVEEIARKLEGRAGPFVDGALGRAMQVGLDALADPGREEALALWRQSAIGAVFELPPAAIAAELARLDPAQIAEALVTLLKAVAAWEKAPEHLERALRAAGGARWSDPLGVVIEAWGFDLPSMRASLDPHFAGRLAALLGSEPFERWLEGGGAS